MLRSRSSACFQRPWCAVTWAVVCNLAFTGLLVSWIMKYADTIVKVYSTSMAMLVTMVGRCRLTQ